MTDGPWLRRLSTGELMILWSSHSSNGYANGVARSSKGNLVGPWMLDDQPLFDDDGGHCMTFTDLNGNLWLSLHHPNDFPNERPWLLHFTEDLLTSRQQIDLDGKMV